MATIRHPVLLLSLCRLTYWAVQSQRYSEQLGTRLSGRRVPAAADDAANTTKEEPTNLAATKKNGELCAQQGGEKRAVR